MSDATLSVGVFNIERFGWDKTKGQHAIRTLTHRLSQHLDGGRYEPLFASRMPPGRRNHLPLLLVNTATVHPLAWHDPAAEDIAYRDSGFAICAIASHQVHLCCEHWTGVREGKLSSAPRSGCPPWAVPGIRPCCWAISTPTAAGHGSCITAGLVCRVRGARQPAQARTKGWINPDTRRWEIDTRQLDKLRTLYGST